MPPKSASPTVKPRLNVYTMMLVVSLIAIIIACVLLWQTLDAYGGWGSWEIPQEVRSGLSYVAPAMFDAAPLV